MGFFDKVKNKIFPDEKEVLYYSSQPVKQEEITLSYDTKDFYSPKSFEETGRLADKLKANGKVVVDIVGLDKTDSMRMIDFLGGITYALNGDMKKLERNIFEFTIPVMDNKNKKKNK